MEAAVLLITHAAVLGIGFALGRIRGYKEALPKRDARGRFTKKD